MLDKERFMRFPEGKAKALTFSYDDGVVYDKKLIKILDAHGLKCTFNLNSGLFEGAGVHNRMDELDTYNTFASSGHEVAVHGARHIFLTKTSVAEGIDEILSDRKYLENKYDRIVRGMAYAYGAFSEVVKQYLALCGIDYARTTVSTRTFDVPTDWLQLNPTCHHNDARLMELADTFVQDSPENAPKAREPWLFYVWGHSYEFDDNNNWHVIEEFAHRVAHRPDVWYATNGEIFDYVTAYNRLVFGCDGSKVYNPTHRTLWLEQREVVYAIAPSETVELR
jgi:peptidoglycan/xylan/chitin deacetylase (PgdA/CDA1 family)